MKCITLLISSGVLVPRTPIKTFSGALRKKPAKTDPCGQLSCSTHQIVLISLQWKQKKKKKSAIPLPKKPKWLLIVFYFYIFWWLGGVTAPHCLFIICDVCSWRGMESLRAERDCSTLVRWWEGGGSAWDCGREEGRENAAVRTFPGWERLCSGRPRLRALKASKGKTRERERGRNKWTMLWSLRGDGCGECAEDADAEDDVDWRHGESHFSEFGSDCPDPPVNLLKLTLSSVWIPEKFQTGAIPCL